MRLRPIAELPLRGTGLRTTSDKSHFVRHLATDFCRTRPHAFRASSKRSGGKWEAGVRARMRSRANAYALARHGKTRKCGGHRKMKRWNLTPQLNIVKE